jgi:TRAP-type C4-dicarboxylate transport system permease small subunit
MTVSPTATIVLGFVLIVACAALRASLERSEGARRFFAGAYRVEMGFVALMLLTLIFLGCAQILLRNAFHSGWLWADPLMRHIVLWLGALGAALASARMHHITVDALSRTLPKNRLAWRRFVVYGVTAVAAYALMVAAVRLVVDERGYGETEFWGVPTWVLQLVIPIAFALIAYRTVLAIFLGREPVESALEE